MLSDFSASKPMDPPIFPQHIYQMQMKLSVNIKTGVGIYE